ncbi:LMBR1-like membrane protein-domain-containing protein [Dichotomocladium elegans]|nr:LMBR1-like membrane protein-domain-containing protein [Dichotomocladium elegans]
MDDGALPQPAPPLESAGSNYAPLILGTLTLLCVAVATVSRFGNLRQYPWYVSTVCVIGWCFPFWIVLLLPLDLASTMYDQCEGECRVPYSHVSQSFLYVAWRTLYWTSFCLTWVMIPMMQAYVNTGDFSITGRLKSAVRVNLQFYSIYLVLGFIGLMYLIFGSGFTTREKIQGYVMAMANSWGLFLVIVLMGYGLVSIPRWLWFTGNTKKRLRQIYARASRVKEECMDAELEFVEIAKTMNVISRQTATQHDPHLAKCVRLMTQRFAFVLDPDFADRENSIRPPQPITEEYLVKLNRRMIIAARMKDRKLALWKNLLDEAFYLQDIITNKNNIDHHFHSTVRPLREVNRWTEYKDFWEWWWVVKIEPIFHRAVAVFFILMSICILWSELVFNMKNPVISLVALGLKSCGFNYAAVEFMSFFTLMYMCICVYTSLFKVRFFNLYLLIPNHHTDENSLLWFTSYLCKMMAPLCYNYINLAGDSSGATETVFNRFMGKADLVFFLGTTFIDWFPVVILIPAVAVFFNFEARCFGLCGVKDPLDEDEASERDSEGHVSLNVEVADGKALIAEERLAVERTINPDLSVQRGFMNRARNALGAYTLKYSRPPSISSGSSARGPSPYTAQNRSVLREERDRRIDEILSGRTTPTPLIGNTPSVSSDGCNSTHHQSGVSSPAGAPGNGLLAIGDTVKNKLNELFSKKDNALMLSGPDVAIAPPPSQLPPHQGNARGGARSAGRVFGRVPSSSAPNSPEPQRARLSRSRSPSPPPPQTGRFRRQHDDPFASIANTSPFSRLDNHQPNRNNIFDNV